MVCVLTAARDKLSYLGLVVEHQELGFQPVSDKEGDHKPSQRLSQDHTRTAVAVCSGIACSHILHHHYKKLHKQKFNLVPRVSHLTA